MKGYFENTIFFKEPILFLVILKWNLLEKSFSCVKKKINPNFAVKHAERSNLSLPVYLMNQLFQGMV